MRGARETTVSTHVLRNFSPQRHIPLPAAAGTTELELSRNMFPLLPEERAARSALCGRQAGKWQRRHGAGPLGNGRPARDAARRSAEF